MDWTKVGAVGSLIGGICAAVTFGATVWPWPQIRALRAKQSDSPKPTLYSPPKLKLFGGLLALSFFLSTISIYSVWRADYDTPIDQMEHVRHRNFLNEIVEIDGRDFEDCTFTNVKLMSHGKKSSAFHHGTFYGTVALATDNDACPASGKQCGVWE